MRKSLICLLLFFALFSCMPFKALIHNIPDKKDIHRFESAKIEAVGEDCFEFKEAVQYYGKQLKVSDWSRDIPFFMNLDSFVQLHQMRSFILIQNDSIKFEYYRKGLNKESLHNSYSIAKSYSSALVGIAIEEKKIKSELDLVLDYIPELKGLQYANELKIKDLLNHTSGIKYSLSLDAQIYYGKDIIKSIKKLKFKQPPGNSQHYLNINTALLGVVLSRATARPVSEYLEEKIWQPLGNCSDAIWLRDKKNKQERSFCCLGATAQDYAKFGRLFLNKGNWNGVQIVPNNWVQKSLARSTGNGSSFNYNYSWHIGLKEYGDFMAIGLYKQHIYIHPKKNIIIVALNDKMKPLKAERLNWWFIFRQIVDQL